MTNQFNIQVGQDVAVMTYWAKMPKRHKVTHVTPTGKFRVEGLDGLITPKETYDHAERTMSWQGRTGNEFRATHVYPWTEAHDRRLEAEAQRRNNERRISLIKQRVSELRVCDTHSIDAICKLFDIE